MTTPVTLPVLLTGITGFIAKRIALDLLEAGYAVRGSLRSAAREAEVRAALAAHLSDPALLDRLSFVTLDLAEDDGWQDALAGTQALVHTASPFPMVQPKDEEAIIRPAVDGALRAMAAAQAAGVTRVVLTSSVVAIEACDKGPGQAFSEADWSDPAHPLSNAYYKSKTLAERAAWAFVEKHPEMQLSTINPSLVLGAPLDAQYGTSLQLIERILRGKDPMLPDIGFGIVDVADVSAAHLAALANPDAAGRRFIASSGSATMPEIGRYLAERHASRRIPTRVAPRIVLQVLSLFDPSIRTVLPGLGRLAQFDASAAERDLGVSFAPWQDAVGRAADAVLAQMD